MAIWHQQFTLSPYYNVSRHCKLNSPNSRGTPISNRNRPIHMKPTKETKTYFYVYCYVVSQESYYFDGYSVRQHRPWETHNTVPGSVPGIRNTHCVIPLTNGAIRMMYYTDADHGSEKKICEAEAMVSTQSVVLLSEENTGAIAQANNTEVSSMPVQHEVAPHASTSTATSASVLNCGSYQAGTITMARKQIKGHESYIVASYPCGSCQVNYGDPSDPKITEEWIWCKKGCKIWFHQTCAEDCGVFDDVDDFTYLKCPWLYVWLMWTWYRNAVDAGEIRILISTVSTLYFAFLYIKGVMIKWRFWSHVCYE